MFRRVSRRVSRGLSRGPARVETRGREGRKGAQRLSKIDPKYPGFFGELLGAPHAAAGPKGETLITPVTPRWIGKMVGLRELRDFQVVGLTWS